MPAEDSHPLQILIENARAVRKRAADALRSNEESRNELRIILSIRGEEGLQDRHTQAENRGRHLERQQENIE